mgnify:CR=1 FL=1|jgi:hypothetical protein
MPVKGVIAILIIAGVFGITYHKQIYNYIKNFFKNTEENDK